MPESSVARLSDENFYFLKESLTVVLDGTLKPLMQQADTGKKPHQDFRKILHKHWEQYHDFDKLVDYGMRKLPKNAKNW